MRPRCRKTCWALMMVWVGAGCALDGDPGGPEPRVSSALIYFDPIGIAPIYRDLVGRGLNGQSWNGKILDGRMVVAVSLDGVQFPSGRQKHLKLEATVFLGIPGPWPDGMRGAVFVGTLDDGDPVHLRVDGVEPVGDPRAGYFAYRVEFFADGTWQPLCGRDEKGDPVPAIPLSGRWDYREGVPGGGSHLEDDRSFTFACEGRVLAKCVAMGYPPWQRGLLCTMGTGHRRSCVRTTLAPFHQACTRAMRADYCGDGLAHTEDGTAVLIYDGVGIRADTEEWLFEAEWDEHGARCLSRQRVASLGEESPCLRERVQESCGNPGHFETGTRLMSEVAGDGMEE